MANKFWFDGFASVAGSMLDPKKWFDGLSSAWLEGVEVELNIDFTGDSVPLIFVDYALIVGTFNTTYHWSKVPVSDPPTYFGGFKDGIITSVGTVSRALSDRNGEYESATWSVTISDKDRTFRGLLDGAYSKYLMNRFIIMRMITDADRRLSRTPRTIALGLVRNYKVEKELKFTLEAKDYLALFTGIGTDANQIPKRTLTRTDFADLPTASIGLPVPIVYGDLRDSGSSLGPVKGVAASEVSLGYKVTGLGMSETTGGNLITGESYYTKVTAVGTDGKEYDFSTQVGIVIAGGGPAKPTYDATLPAPELFGIGGLTGRPQGFPNYRWGLLTSLKYTGGVWYESAASGWGDVHGDQAPNTVGSCALVKTIGSPDRIRFYIFNVNNGGFDPQLNPTTVVGVTGDTTPVVRIVEVDLAGTVYSAKLGGLTDGDYTGPITASPFGDQSSTGADRWICLYSDADGDNFQTTSVGAAVAVSWSAWTPPSGVSLSTYRVYFWNGSEWRWFDVAGTSTTITDTGVGVVTSGGNYVYAVTGVFASEETALSTEATGTFLERVVRPGILITWNPLQDAASYYVYRRPTGGSGEVAGLYNTRWPVSGKSSMVDDFLGTGAETITGYSTSSGILPLTYVGDVTLGSQTWKRFVVCGHAVKELTAVYQKNASNESFSQISSAQYNVDFLVPGQAGWSTYFATTYEDIGGHRYTCVYARGTAGDAAADGTRPLRANLQGIEDVGDSTGTLLTNLLDQYLHFLRNWLLQDYQTGAWLSGPVWPNSEPSVQVIDDNSFETAKLVADERLSGGYIGSFAVGANGEQTTIREWLKRLNLSCDVFAGFSRKSQFRVVMLDDQLTALSGVKHYTQEREIFAGSFDTVDDVEATENVIPFSYKRDYSTDTWLVDAQEITDADSVTYSGQSKKASLVELWLVRGQAIAEDIIRRRLARSKLPPRTVTFETSLPGLNTDLGDYIEITHLEGPGVGGWVRRPCFVTRHEFSQDSLTVQIEALDVARLFGSAFILGNETVLPATWTAATETEKTYGFLGDETTKLFSDGTPIKRLR